MILKKKWKKNNQAKIRSFTDRIFACCWNGVNSNRVPNFHKICIKFIDNKDNLHYTINTWC